MSTPLPPPPPGAVPRPPAAAKKGIPKIAIIIGAVVLGAVAVTVATSGKGTKTVAATTTVVTAADVNGRPGTIVPGSPGETQPVSVTGTSLVELPEKGDDPALGAKAPTMSGRDFSGKPVVVTPGDGKAKLLVFVAHWCPHCQREVPLLTKWRADGSIPASVDLVAISTGYHADRGNPPSTWLAKEGWPGIIVADDEKSTAAVAYGLTGFPFFTLLDANGNVVARDSGELDLSTVKAILAKLSQ